MLTPASLSFVSTAALPRTLTLATLAAVFAAPAAAQCPAEPTLQNWTGAGRVTCPCFVQGEEAAVILQAPASHYPIEILKIQVGWGSQFGGAPQSLENALHIYANGLPNPGTPQFSLPGPALTDGFINEFDISLTPGNKIINSGPFTISLEFQNTNAGQIFSPSVVHDGNGCQPGRNAVFAIPGGWSDACALGVSGDWAMGVVYRRVNCSTATCTLRNGTGVNPTDFTCVAPPVLGSSWQTSIATPPGTLSTAIAIAAAPSAAPIPLFGGEMLLTLSPPPLLEQAFGSHSIPIPNVPALNLANVYTQGIRISLGGGGPSLTLLNALDLVLGT